MRYGVYGKLRTKPGRRDEFVRILLRDVEELRAVGCELYAVNLAQDDPDVVWVTEVWPSRESHRSSLGLPTVKQAIAEGMPLLTGEFDRVDLDVVGGLGIISAD